MTEKSPYEQFDYWNRIATDAMKAVEVAHSNMRKIMAELALTEVERPYLHLVNPDEYREQP